VDSISAPTGGATRFGRAPDKLWSVGMNNLAGLWGIVIVGGPVALLIAFVWAKTRTTSKTRADDPDTAWDDPSKGMPGHD
jgi:hypothetical protein